MGGLYALSKHQEEAQNLQMEQRDTVVYVPTEIESVHAQAVINTTQTDGEKKITEYQLVFTVMILFVMNLK